MGRGRSGRWTKMVTGGHAGASENNKGTYFAKKIEGRHKGQEKLPLARVC